MIIFNIGIGALPIHVAQRDVGRGLRNTCRPVTLCAQSTFTL
ncbi:hypothetical protein [Pseudorhodobacter sp.]|nr:hypothetical protein [Pseudorhodobacter sp.]